MSSEQPVDVEWWHKQIEASYALGCYTGDSAQTIVDNLDELLIDYDKLLTRLKAAEAEVESYQQILSDRVGPDIAAINALEAENAALQSRLTALVEAGSNLMGALNNDGEISAEEYEQCVREFNFALRAAAEGGA